MKDPIRRVFYLLGIAVFSIVFDIFFEQYNRLELYWIISAFLDLTFWTIAFYPKYRWRFMGFFRRVILIGVSLRFCLYFLPTEILLSDTFGYVERVINIVLIVAIIYDNDDRGGGKGKRAEDTEEEVDKHRLATDNI